ncbi:MAG: efflux RND transporter permease subunit, partial [Nevskiales bacterium]
KSDEDTVVRLGDVADVVLGAENYDQSAGWNGSPAIFIAINGRPDANVLDVIDQVRDVWPGIKANLPEGLDAAIGYDATEYIRQAITEVEKTLIEAVLIVVVVIFLFLGSVRSSFIPAVTVPLSLVGALFIMLVMGFSVNLLTLLAMVLAIGMVVDDAIIVLENVHRHIEEGLKPFDAAIKGARELVGPVIAMTITLIAVYAPIGFLSGITGKLFIEFAFTLAGAVLISGVVALTLTPMMCARILQDSSHESRLANWLDSKFDAWKNAYQQRLHGALETPYIIAIFGGIVFVSCYFLFISTPAELAPNEDRGFAIAINEIDGFASQEYLQEVSSQAHKVALNHPQISHMFTFSNDDGGSTNRSFMGMITVPWTERDKTTETIVNELAPELADIPGLRSTVIQPPPLPTPGQGYPVQFIIKGTTDPAT